MVTSQADLYEHTAPSISAAIGLARAEGYFRVYGIGGQGVYEAMLPMAHRLLLTEVNTVVEDADAFFPAFDETGWKELSNRGLQSEAFGCVVRELVR